MQSIELTLLEKKIPEEHDTSIPNYDEHIELFEQVRNKRLSDSFLLARARLNAATYNYQTIWNRIKLIQKLLDNEKHELIYQKGPSNLALRILMEMHNIHVKQLTEEVEKCEKAWSHFSVQKIMYLRVMRHIEDKISKSRTRGSRKRKNR